MAVFVFANNCNTTLASPITTTGQTSITLTSSANLPSVSAGQQFALTLNDAATQSVFEVVYVTAISGATLTVVRGQEGTSATTWLASDYAFASVTQGILAVLQAGSSSQAYATSTLTASGEITSAGAIVAGSGTASSVTAGDVAGSRSTTTGALSLGGSSSNGVLDYNITNPNTFAMNKALFLGGISAYAVYGQGQALTAGDVNASRSTTTGSITIGGSSSYATIDYGVTGAGVVTISKNTSVPAGYLTVGPSGVSGTLGDLNVSRSTTTGAIYLGGASSNVELDYGITQASALTVNKQFNANGGIVIGSVSGGGQLRVCSDAPYASSAQGVLYLGGASSQVLIDYGSTTPNQLTIGSSAYFNGQIIAGSSAANALAANGGITPGHGGSTGAAGIFGGTGSPSFSAANGSLFLRYDGGSNTRLYINTSGASTSGTTWTAVTD